MRLRPRIRIAVYDGFPLDANRGGIAHSDSVNGCVTRKPDAPPWNDPGRISVTICRPALPGGRLLRSFTALESQHKVARKGDG